MTLERLAASPHGIDFGPLESRISDVVTTASGKVELAPGPIIADLSRLAAAVSEYEAGGLVLVGRRELRSNNSWLHNTEVLVRSRHRCTLHVHPADAKRANVEDGDDVAVTSRVGSLTATVEVTDSVMEGVVCLPYGWGHDMAGSRLSVASQHPGVNTNLLTDAAPIDPLSGNAVLNGIPVELSRPA